MLRVLVLSSIFIFGDAFSVSSLPKCSMTDSDCQKEVFQTILSSIGKTGIKELGIPPFDPLELKNVSVAISDLLEITLVDGVAKGVKDCEINRIVTDIPRGVSSMDWTCDIVIKGHYKASSSSPLIKSVLGGGFIHGDGFGKVKVDKIRLHFDSQIYVRRGDDGELYLSEVRNQTKHSFEILGNIVFAANNIILGNDDVSATIVQLLNQNAKSLAPFFGEPFMQKALELADSLTGKFFDFVPARFYIKEDLSPYVKA